MIAKIFTITTVLSLLYIVGGAMTYTLMYLTHEMFKRNGWDDPSDNQTIMIFLAEAFLSYSGLTALFIRLVYHK